MAKRREGGGREPTSIHNQVPGCHFFVVLARTSPAVRGNDAADDEGGEEYIRGGVVWANGCCC